MSVKTATKKPVTIEFIEWTGQNAINVVTFVDGEPRLSSQSVWDLWHENCRKVLTEGLVIQTLEGPLSAKVGDLIIKGVQGEFYLCKPDIFAKTYDIN